MAESYRRLCVFEEDEYSRTYCTQQEFIDHVNNLPPEEKIVESIPTETLRWCVEPAIELWSDDILYHLDRVRDASLEYPPVIYNKAIADGVHRIVKASSLNLDSMQVIRVSSIPPLRSEFKQPYWDMVSGLEEMANILEIE